ncbi:porin [Novosphingobium terrae]|uniref:porin n=1 Tax=Novosphingobium terrae TaxID=2726189 RepID=UPI001F12E4B6|nr:porin [Novosphingobium terrae]
MSNKAGARTGTGQNPAARVRKAGQRGRPTEQTLYGLALIALSLAAPDRAQAQDTAAAPSNDPIIYLMQSLKARGVLTQQDYDAVIARMKPAAPASNAIAVQTTPAPSPSGTTQLASAAETVPVTAPATAAAPDKGLKVTGSLDHGLGLAVGDVRLTLHGSVNGYYVHNSGSPADAAHTVNGGVAQAGQTSSSIRSGFAPAYLVGNVATTQRGWDIGMTLGFYPGITSIAAGAGSPQAFQTGGLDIRQVNLTLSRPGVGEFKIGRDTGLFGVDAELQDMVLLGVGIAPANPAPTNSTLGRIGAGYIYSDWIPQITYTTPNIKGFKASVGVFQPLETVGRSEVNSTPGFQYRLTYNTKINDLSATLWSSAIIQKHDPMTGAVGTPYTGKGIDMGAKLGYGPFALTGYYYTSQGLGIIGLFQLAVADNGNTRKGDGYYLQGTYKVGRFQFGGSYGGSSLGLAKDEPVSDLVKHTYTSAGQIRYQLTDWVTLIGEYFHTDSTAHNGNKASSDTISTGATLAF